MLNPKGKTAMETTHLLLDENQEPLKLYHGTRTYFDTFRPFSHFGTILAAQEAATCWARKNRPELLDYRGMVHNDLHASDEKTGETYIIPVHLRMIHPYRCLDLTSHVIENYKKLVLNELINDNITMALKNSYPVLRKFNVIALLDASIMEHSVSPYYNMIFRDPYEMSSDAVQRELSLDTIYMPAIKGVRPYSIDETNRHHLVFQRMARYFERRGYDGFVYQNHSEDAGSDSYIIFRPQQVVRLDRSICNLEYPVRNEEQKKQLNQLELDAYQRSEEYILNQDDCSRMELFQMKIAETISPEKRGKELELAMLRYQITCNG